MIIKNQSTTTINISGTTVRPGESTEVYERCFDTHNINAIGGYVTIDTEYSERHIHNFGNLVAEEGEIVGPGTLREIIVRDKTAEDESAS